MGVPSPQVAKEEGVGVDGGKDRRAGRTTEHETAPATPTALPRYIWRWRCCQCTQSTLIPVNTEVCAGCQHSRCYQCPLERIKVKTNRVGFAFQGLI